MPRKFSIVGEPAIIMTIVATLIRLGAAHFINTTAEQQTWVNAVVTAGAGLVSAVWVTHNKQVPALIGFAQALIALGVGFGFHISADAEAAILSIIGGIAALFIRTQVVAPGSDPAVLAARR
jgi:hypothetical protein